MATATVPTVEQVTAALATVEDPEIHKPITELDMVSRWRSERTAGSPWSWLTVAGCPMRDEITRRVTAAVAALPGTTAVQVELDVMSDEQRSALSTRLRGGQAVRDIPFAQPGSLTRVYAVASGKGGVGKSSVTVNLAAAMAARADGRRRRRGHLRPLDAADARASPASRPRSTA